MHKGWYQIAFEAELVDQITPIKFDDQSYIIIKEAGTFKVFDAFCPHRGAHIAIGGKLDGDSVICPFHGLRIHLGVCEGNNMSIKEYATLSAGGLVFVCFEQGPETGFKEYISKIALGHFIYPGFKMNVQAPFELIIENAFDNMHFKSVHKIFNEPDFQIEPSYSGEYGVTGEFAIPSSQYQRDIPSGQVKMLPFHAIAFSPGIVVSKLGGAFEYFIITSSIPALNNITTIRLSIAIKRDENLPSETDCEYLATQSQLGLMADKLIWENMNLKIKPILTKGDSAVIGFKEFCKGFTDCFSSK